MQLPDDHDAAIVAEGMLRLHDAPQNEDGVLQRGSLFDRWPSALQNRRSTNRQEGQQ